MLVSVVAALGGLLAAGGACAAVEVKVEPPAVAHVEFARRKPPDDRLLGGDDAGALCHTVFEIEAGIASSIDPIGPAAVRAYPTDFDVTTRLKITIYLPKNAPDELRAHEEGHRAIAEHYYGHAAAAARAAVAAVQGQAFEAAGADRAAAEQAVGALIRAALKDAFMQKTQARSAAANARYDAITKHGREALAAFDAVAAAIAEDP